MKEKYIEPIIEIIHFSSYDVICTGSDSGFVYGDDGNGNNSNSLNSFE